MRFGPPRTYNSQEADDYWKGPLGYGWSSLLTTRLERWPVVPGNGGQVDVDGIVGVVAPDGARTFFTHMGLASSEYRARGSVKASLTRQSGPVFTFTDADRTEWHFDGSLLDYVEDRNGNKLTLQRTSGRVTDVVSDDGRSVHLTYNTDGTVATATDPEGRTASYAYSGGDLVSVTDPDGKTESYGYDAKHRMTSWTDPRGHETTTDYDTSGRVIAQTDRLDHETTWAYSGATTTVTHPSGAKTRETFKDFLPTKIISGYSSPQAGTKSIAYNGDREPTLVTDPNGHETSFEWDEDGNLLSSTDPLDHTTSWTYNSHHQPTSETSPSGKTKTMAYDTAGNLTSVTRTTTGTSTDLVDEFDYDAHGQLISSTDPLNHEWTYTYSSAGDQLSATSPKGRKTTWTFNDDGEVLTRVSPLGNVTGGTPADHRTAIDRDPAGLITTVTDPRGHDSTFAYDDNGNPTDVTDPDGRHTETTYDAADQPTEVTRDDNSSTHVTYDEDGRVSSRFDGLDHQTAYAYDGQGRLSSVTDAADRTWTYGYDSAGNRTSVTDPASRVIESDYDDANRLTDINYSSGDPGDVAFTYTADGQRHTMADDSGTTTYDYDSLGRLTSVEDGAGKTVGYDYDLAGRQTQINYPASSGSRTVTRSYDQDDRLTAVTDWLSHTTGFDYDADGNLASTQRPNGIDTSYGYDRNGGLLTIDDDATGLTTYTRTNAELLASQQAGSATAQTFGHDVTGRLTGSPFGTYAYDDADQLTTMRDPLGTAIAQVYDTVGQLDTATPSGGQASSYDYDAQGNRTATDAPTGPDTTYTYDQANQLTSYDGPDHAATTGTVQTHYAYDGDGQRTSSKTGTAAAKDMTWDVAGSLLLTDDDTTYIYGPGGAPVEQIDDQGRPAYFLADQLGSTTALTSQAGATVATLAYDTYGNTDATATSTTSGYDTRLRYTGEYQDAATGLEYLRARYYDPATGQFITRDPIEDATGQPYSYAGGNPTDATDPSGLLFSIHISLPSTQAIADAAAGFGDAASFGITKRVRQHFGIDNVDYCDGAYTGGEFGGTVAGFVVPIPGGAGLRAARALRGSRAGQAAARVGGGRLSRLKTMLQSETGSFRFPFRTTQNFDNVTQRLAKNHGVDPNVASTRLHEIKEAAGRGPADNVRFDMTGNVYDPETGDWLGSLTAGGGR